MKPPYRITSHMLDLYGKIKESLGVCKGLLLVEPDTKLRRQNRIKTIQATLAIEGNQLTRDQVTAIINNKRVIGPKNDITEVENAIKVYEHVWSYDPHNPSDLLKAHARMLRGLADQPGIFRNSQVGIANGNTITHIAPPAERVPQLMHDLFEYLLHDDDLPIIKSCVFHYEIEFIHPFEDGNGRMGRLWQTLLLMKVDPIFAYVPIESMILERQQSYYDALVASDQSGESTPFIEFMLSIIQTTLADLVDDTKAVPNDYQQRKNHLIAHLDTWFDRKTYMELCKGISTATASRDLNRMVSEGLLKIQGSGRMRKYHV
ncbi:MAG TPA: cell filamentation protein Fic [Sphaerochaeta sp.]|nr:cell filamentation protein Fic [Sphaerochaeta sp.]